MQSFHQHGAVLGAASGHRVCLYRNRPGLFWGVSSSPLRPVQATTRLDNHFQIHRHTAPSVIPHPVATGGRSNGQDRKVHCVGRARLLTRGLFNSAHHGMKNGRIASEKYCADNSNFESREPLKIASVHASTNSARTELID